MAVRPRVDLLFAMTCSEMKQHWLDVLAAAAVAVDDALAANALPSKAASAERKRLADELGWVEELEWSELERALAPVKRVEPERRRSTANGAPRHSAPDKEVVTMLTRKDLAATALTAAIVLTFAATHEGWGVPLVGDSHRWATAAVFLLGSGTCGLGSSERPTRVFPVLGVAAFVLGAVALATGSLTALSFLVGVIVLMWALATARHAGFPRSPAAIGRSPHPTPR